MPAIKKKVGKKKDEARKERYEVLYENIISEVKLLAEVMDVMKDELKADIYEFKSEMKTDYRFLETAIGLNAEEIRAAKEEVIVNRKAIRENKQAIEKNREAIDKNREAIDKNREAIDKNREAIEGNTVAIERVDAKLDRHGKLINEHERMLKAS